MTFTTFGRRKACALLVSCCGPNVFLLVSFCWMDWALSPGSIQDGWAASPCFVTGVIPRGPVAGNTVFPQRTRSQFVRSLPCQLRGKPKLPVDLEESTFLLVSMYAPFFVPLGDTHRGMLHVSLNGCSVCFTLSYTRMHSIHLSANPH